MKIEFLVGFMGIYPHRHVSLPKTFKQNQVKSREQTTEDKCFVLSSLLPPLSLSLSPSPPPPLCLCWCQVTSSVILYISLCVTGLFTHRFSRLAGQWALGIHLFPTLPSPRLQAHGPGNLNSGPYLCMVSTLPARQSPQPVFTYLLILC